MLQSRRGRTVCALFLGLCIQAPGRAVRGDDNGSDTRCGLYCLFTALAANDRAPKSLHDLERSLGGPPDVRGYSLAQLQQQAGQAGLETAAVETTWDNLQSRNEPFVCITLVKPNHFLILYDVDPQTAYVLDPPRLKQIPRPTFEKLWTRKALLIGSSPFTREEDLSAGNDAGRLPRIPGLGLACGGAVIAALLLARRWKGIARGMGLAVIGSLAFAGPGCSGASDTPAGPFQPAAPISQGLAAEPAAHRLGSLLIGSTTEPIRIVTALRNNTDRTIRIVEVRESCTCTTGSLSTDVLLPRTAAVLTTLLHPGEVQGERVSAIEIRTDDPSSRILPIHFQWTNLARLATIPPTVEVGIIRSSEKAHGILRLMTNGVDFCDECTLDARSDHPDITCDLKEAIPSRSAHGRTVPVASRANVGSLSYEIQPRDEHGQQGAMIRLVVRCGRQERCPTSIPVHWEVRPLISISPDRLWLGRIRSGESAHAVIIL